MNKWHPYHSLPFFIPLQDDAAKVSDALDQLYGAKEIEDIKLLFGTVGSLLRGRAIATPDKPFSNPVESLKRL